MSENDDTVTVTLTARDARFAVAHLRYLADREVAHDAEHAAANLTARFVADEIEHSVPSEPVSEVRR